MIEVESTRRYKHRFYVVLILIDCFMLHRYIFMLCQGKITDVIKDPAFEFYLSVVAIFSIAYLIRNWDVYRKVIFVRGLILLVSKVSVLYRFILQCIILAFILIIALLLLVYVGIMKPSIEIVPKFGISDILIGIISTTTLLLYYREIREKFHPVKVICTGVEGLSHEVIVYLVVINNSDTVQELDINILFIDDKYCIIYTSGDVNCIKIDESIVFIRDKPENKLVIPSKAYGRIILSIDLAKSNLDKVMKRIESMHMVVECIIWQENDIVKVEHIPKNLRQKFTKFSILKPIHNPRG